MAWTRRARHVSDTPPRPRGGLRVPEGGRVLLDSGSMQYRPTLLLFSLLVVLSTGCDDSSGHSTTDGGTDAGGDAGDSAAPVPGASGTLTVSNPTSSSFDVAWTAATDETSAPAQLEYRVYYSLSNNLDSVANVLANGTAAGDWQAGIDHLAVSSLSLETSYHVNVLVRDGAGNVAVYGGASGLTLAGTWQALEPLGNYTGGSAYYSKLSAASTGAVAVRWDYSPTWEAHYAVRTADATAFGAVAEWAPAGNTTSSIAYDPTDHLMGVTIHHGTSTDDLLLQRDPGTGSLVTETVATGFATYAIHSTRFCVASNGDVMVVWMEGLGTASSAVRARVRSGGTWGSVFDATASDGLDINTLEVACDPGGDHVVLWGQAGTANTLQARRYDASATAWAGPSASLGTASYQYRVETARTTAGRIVVMWTEFDSATSTSYVLARTLEGAAWSATSSTLASSDTLSFNTIALAAAGTDAHAVWFAGPQLVASRLAGSGATWSTASPVYTASSPQELALTGDAAGDALIVTVDSTGILARRYTLASGTWSSGTELLPAGSSIGYGSLAAVLDARRRATVVWTTWNATDSRFSATSRTYR